MRIRKTDFTGTGKVYRFTLSQMVKGKANIISMVIFFLISALSFPAMALMTGGQEQEISDITAVYVGNDTGYELDLAGIPVKNDTFADTEFEDIVNADETEETYKSRLTPSEAYVRIQRDAEKMCFTVEAYTLEEKDFSDGDLEACIEALSGELNEARYSQQNAEPDQIAVLTSPYDTKVQSVSEYLEAKEDNFDARFGVQMLYSILLLVLCTFVSSYIIQKVIEEKASKLAEFLLVSVRPLAMLLGKILAVMTYVFGLVAGIAAVQGISYLITSRFTDAPLLQQMGAAGISLETLRLSPAVILVLVISLILGYLQISLISGLLGTSCSSTEDVEPANLVVVVLVLAGYFAATVTVGFGNNQALTYLVSLFPVASMFCAPVRYIVGDIGMGAMMLSWLIQIIVILLLAYVCARIYRALMMYRGNRMKLGGWITMFRQNRGEGAE